MPSIIVGFVPSIFYNTLFIPTTPPPIYYIYVMAPAKKKTDQTGQTGQNSQPDSPTFESALSELEGITRQLERDDLPLEEALASFEEGVRLMRVCDAHLRNVRGRLMELVRGDDGGLITEILGESLESFSGGENGDG